MITSFHTAVCLLLLQVNESRTINQFQYLDWPEDRCPTSASNVIDMIGWLTKMQYHRGGGPVVIHDWYVCNYVFIM